MKAKFVCKIHFLFSSHLCFVNRLSEKKSKILNDNTILDSIVKNITKFFLNFDSDDVPSPFYILPFFLFPSVLSTNIDQHKSIFITMSEKLI